MKNRLFFSILLCTFFHLGVSAQVKNYALQFKQNGKVNFDRISELDYRTSFTIQLWINPQKWNVGSVLFTRGEGDSEFSAKLGNQNQLIFQFGKDQVVAQSLFLTTGAWSQLTFVCDNGDITFLLNNKEILKENRTLAIPQSYSPFILGGNGYEGLVDELRIWNTAINDKFFQLWRNTVNKHHPNWSDLVLYCKFDQNQCESVVDYKFKHHGSFSATGVTRGEVIDNELFKYRTSVAYSNFSRWADREIDQDKYLLSNDLIMLDFAPDVNGNIIMPYPNNQGSVTNCSYLQEYKGRKGVVSFNGDGAQMDVGVNAFNPVDKYTFTTWIYLEQWKEGAYIFRKEKSDNEGFSIRLGEEDKKRIIIRVNGIEYSRINYMKVNEWVYLSVSAFSTVKNQVFQISFNGQTYYATNNAQEVNNYQVTGLDKTTAYVGQNLNAKFDETAIFHDYRAGSYGMNGCPIPGPTTKVEAQTLQSCNSYWKYDKEENPGYDSYSYKHFLQVIRDNYAGHRGYLIRAGIHSFTGWESRFSDPVFRSRFADEIARIVADFDGVDLDFEWCYDQTCWDNYGQVITAIKSKLPSGKVFSVTPHYVSYSLKPEYVNAVDYFPFQIYGPSKNVFLWDTYVDAYNRFVAGGRYPKDKIVLSYATTTSKGYDVNSDQQLGSAPIGVINGLLDRGYTPDMNNVIDQSNQRRYFTGYNQVIDRCEFVQDKDLKGIMYWDMGNDVKTSHPFSLVKAASFSIASNVDTLVLRVDKIPTSIETPGMGSSAIRVAPNPARAVTRILLSEGLIVERALIMNQSGVTVKIFTNTDIIDVSDVTPGFYMLQVQCKNKENYTTRLIVNK